jgi:hypothetical protein
MLEAAIGSDDRDPVGQAKVAELVDALDLGSSGVTRESSSLSFRTTPGFAFSQGWSRRFW